MTKIFTHENYSLGSCDILQRIACTSYLSVQLNYISKLIKKKLILAQIFLQYA